MSAMDLVAVVAAVLGAIALAGGCVAFFAAATRLRAAARELEAAAAAFADAAEPLVEDLNSSVERAAGEVERVEHLLDLSSGIGRRVEGATGATYRALTTPVIKGAAVAEGTRRAARRLGGRRS
ncbi:MAG: hypothetical protein M9942_11290 [Microthrixaceae bacterium]|nr:hypothetical protein [Microthrixaceae bacterium]